MSPFYSRILIIASGIVSIIIIGICILNPDLLLLLRAQVPPQISSTSKVLTWTPNENTPTGDISVKINATDSKGAQSSQDIIISVGTPSSTSPTPTITTSPLPSPTTAVISETPTMSPAENMQHNDESATSTPKEEPTPTPAPSFRTYIYQAESASKIEGSYSGIESGDAGQVVKLAANDSLLSKQANVIQDNYYFDIRVRDDRPGPINVVIMLDNNAWKVITLPKSDNNYRTRRVGLLRNFKKATIRFRLLNDSYDKTDPSNESQDRNLFIDWWRLTTDESASAELASSPTTSASTTSGGSTLISNLNTVINQELGTAFIRPDIIRYYSGRLNLPGNNAAAIKSEGQLRSVMRYWKGVRPNNPRGDSF